MAQIRQCLTFMLKSLDQSLGQEPGLDELDCHDMVEVAANPLALVNGPHAATPDDVDDAILPDPFGRRLILDHRSGHAGLQSGIGICCQQRFQPRPQFRFPRRARVDPCGPSIRVNREHLPEKLDDPYFSFVSSEEHTSELQSLMHTSYA